MSKLTSLGVNNLECTPVIPDLLNSSKYIACFYFKDTLLIPFDDTPNQNLEINLAGMRLRIICHGHCYRQLTVRQKSHRARITRVILLPISQRVCGSVSVLTIKGSLIA